MPISPMERQLRGWLSAGKFFVQGRLIVARLFQRALSEMGMGRFVTYSGRTMTSGEIYDRNIEAILNAYAIYLGLPLILNFSGDYIRNHPFALEFFRKWAITDEYFRLIDQQDPRTRPYGSWQTYRDTILAVLPFSQFLYSLFNPRSSLFTTELYKQGSMLLAFDDLEVNEAQTALEIGRKLKDTTSSNVLFTVQLEDISKANPFMSLETTILFSYLHLLQVYREYRKQEDAKGMIPAFIKHQTAKAIVDGELKQRIPFDLDGRLKIEIPQDQVKVAWLTLDTYGLQLVTPLTETPPGEPSISLKYRLHLPTEQKPRPPTAILSIAGAYFKGVSLQMPTTTLKIAFTRLTFSARIIAHATKKTPRQDIMLKLTIRQVPRKTFALTTKAVKKSP